MKDKKESFRGKNSVKCTPVDWNKYANDRETLEAERKKKNKLQWEQPEITDKWAVNNKRPEVKLSTNDEKGTISDAEIDSIGEKIIATTSRVKKDDDFFANAMAEVSKAVKEAENEGFFLDDGLGGTFELPELDIHFGDTRELAEVKPALMDENLAAIAGRFEADEDKQEPVEPLTYAPAKDYKKEEAKKSDVDNASVQSEDKADIKADIKEESKSKSMTDTKNVLKPEINKPVEAKKEEPVKEADTIKKSPAVKDNAEVKKSNKKDIKSPEKADDFDLSAAIEATTDKAINTKVEKEALEATVANSGETIISDKIDDIFMDKVVVQSDELKEKKSLLKRNKKQDKAVAKKNDKNKALPAKTAGAINAHKEHKKAGNSKAAMATDAYSKNAMPAKKNKSDFKKKSADWRDEKIVDKGAHVAAVKSVSLSDRIRKVTPIQWAIVAMALMIFVSGIMTSAVYASYRSEQNKAIAIATLSQYSEEDNSMTVAEITEEMLTEETVAEPETTAAKALSLVLTSVEKDLKIKLVDEEDTLVKDVAWSVELTDEDDNSTEEVDDDKDGIIHLTEIDAGDYSVELIPSEELAAYVLPQDKQLVSVKAKVEYKVIANIRDEIKSEKEVNAALEDANGNQAADVETGSKPSDTVEYVETTKTADGEEWVEATPDLSKTAKAVKEKNGILTALANFGKKTKSVFGNGYVEASILHVADTRTVATAETGDEVPTAPEEPAPADVPTAPEEPAPEEPAPADNPTDVPSDPGNTDNPGEGTGGDSGNGSGNNETEVPISDDGGSKKKNENKNNNGGDSNNNGNQNNTEEASIQLSGASTVAKGSTITINATVTPADATISWSSSDSSVATATGQGASCSVKGVNEGSVTITATSSYGKQATMTVKVSSEYSDDAQLYDASKNPLYVNDNGEYRLAKYSDYKNGTFTVFYRKADGYVYTGWQTIDGKTYYYKADHTYVTGEQIIQGIKYVFGADGALSNNSGTLGIDVSKYQPSINWSSVKVSGISYVIIRCGYRGASTGVLIQDPYFTSHIKGAKAAGLKVGVYFFTTALTEAEAVEEASMCAALCSGYGINYPIFMDCESSSRPGYNSLSSSQRTAIIKAFCNTIKSAGYTPGVYANKTWLSSYMNTSALSGVKIWLAQYNAGGPTYSGRYDLWQYTSKGKVNGISGNVDMNQSYLGY